MKQLQAEEQAKEQKIFRKTRNGMCVVVFITFLLAA